MRKTSDILGIPIDCVNMQEALERIKLFLSEDKAHSVYTPNSEIMMEAQRDPYLKDILCSADLLIADGAGVVMASRMLGCDLPERVTGVDLANNILSLDIGRPIRLYLFGGKPGVAEKARDNILARYGNVEICGCRNGYFSPEEVPGIISEINSTHSDVLLVALGRKKQESFIHENKNDLNAKVCIGCGGTIDIFAGTAELAPDFFRNHSLEWLFRLYKEPWRYKRMLDLPRFMFTVFKQKLRKKA
ncbi:MAG TPA: WecB/TagA/CpsF family glycosyltransferase [Clostridiaceae bacterium]|jgi:N-acetylglucosaminyldiphosphoundecaprenol N-acetyl-beta-D-mannosaminyltransferase|nr:WecB/TagA/CpsF family glycosyltransferase [Clostridiaceae bacterium]